MSNKMQTGPVGKTLVFLALPTTISLLANMLFQLIDSYFIAQLGTQQLVSMGFVYPVYILIFGITGGIATGVTVMISKSVANNDISGVRDQAFISIMFFMFFAFLLGLVILAIQSPLFTVIGASDSIISVLREYTDTLFLGLFLFAGCLMTNAVLMSQGRVVAISIIWAIGGITNVTLDYILIFGAGDIPPLGLHGAALATLASWLVVLICMLFVLVRSVSFSIKPLFNLALIVSTLATVFKVGIPSASTQILNPIAMMLLTKMVAGFGDTAVAALSICIRIESVSLALYSALSIVFTPFVAQNSTASNMARVKQGSHFLQNAIWIWWIALMTVIIAFSEPFISFFTSNAEVAAAAKSYMLIVGLSYGLYGIHQITSSYFNAQQLARKALMMGVVRSYLFMVPLAFVASFIGIQAIWWAIAAANILTGIYAWAQMRKNILRYDVAIGINVLNKGPAGN